MTEGRRCQVHLLDDRKLELLVQVSHSASLPPSRSFFSFLPLSLSLLTLISLERERSDVWCPEGLSYCWPGEIWSAVGDFVLSWCSPDLSIQTHIKKSTYTSGPSPHLLSLQKLCIPLQFSPNDVLNKNYYFPYSNSCFTAHSSSPISAALPECLSKARII